MRRHFTFLLTATAILGIAALANAADNLPYQYSVPINPNGQFRYPPYHTRLVLPARMHRQVEVSRSLAAQPVHPHMVKVVLSGGSGILHTWIDPVRRLDAGERRLDENHSLVKAQRLARQLMGITTNDLAELSNRSQAIKAAQLTPANRAKIVQSPKAAAPTPRIIFMRPANQPNTKPSIPSVPKPPKTNPRQMALAR